MTATNLIERHSKTSINVMAMEQSYPHDSSNKVEIREVVRVNARVCIDLKSVDVLSAVLEQAVVRVEHFMRQEVEPLPSHASIVQTLFPLELDH